MAITIIGLPFAKQSLKLAGYALWPFGRQGPTTMRNCRSSFWEAARRRERLSCRPSE
jgi:uncharacterized membrane protein YccF (DUF307 family)